MEIWLELVEIIQISLDYFNGTGKFPNAVDRRVIKRICNTKTEVPND